MRLSRQSPVRYPLIAAQLPWDSVPTLCGDGIKTATMFTISCGEDVDFENVGANFFNLRVLYRTVDYKDSIIAILSHDHMLFQQMPVYFPLRIEMVQIWK